VNDADRDYILQQLGPDTTGVTTRAVAARDAQGRPSVITNHPLRRQAGRLLPFPTLYWLIDPVRCRQVADLERDGAVGALERTIAADDALREGLRGDHRRYAAARWALLTPDEQRYAIDAGYAPALRDKGIGGIADFTRLKCLHLHLAHHLAEHAAGRGGTTAGRLIEGLLAAPRRV
jgi:hypothetical protein